MIWPSCTMNKIKVNNLLLKIYAPLEQKPPERKKEFKNTHFEKSTEALGEISPIRDGRKVQK